MSMKRAGIVGALLASTLAFTGCSNSGGATTAQDASADYGLQASGLPIVTKQLTLKFSGSKAPLAPDYSSMSLVQQWEKDTNIHIDWQNLPDATYQEKKNLILASGDLPDAFFNTGLTDAEVATAAANGTLVPLEGLIDKYAPNLSKLFKERPDVKAAVTSSDGHIYTLPTVQELGLTQFAPMLAINTKWLKELNLRMPTTIQQLHDTLLAFKQKDPAGGGKTIPLSFEQGQWTADITDIVAALGGLPDNQDHRIVKDGKVSFTANTPQFKQALSTLHQWYQEGLIDPEAYSQDDKAYLAKGKTATESLGMFSWWEIKEMVGQNRVGDYALMPILAGVNGQKIASRSNASDIGRNAFAITRADKYPAATMRWADHLYDPVQSAQANWGPIGVTLQKDAATGILTQIPADASTSEGERRQKVAPRGPFAVTADDFKTVVAPEPRAAERQQIVKDMYLPYAGNDKFPPVMLSTDELQQINGPQTDIATLVKQKIAKWVVAGGIDQEWDGYVSQLNSIGVDKVISVYQQAYDRYKKNS
ncbi:ABC transporter substrate-binding protein [Sinomonas sp. P47F7]|uniref:ABC transporter substrate-binding protein n=1 Tax=Sinomonas sp. P47F7 TaxID=3410987 RepID=UPI003BF611C1